MSKEEVDLLGLDLDALEDPPKTTMFTGLTDIDLLTDRFQLYVEHCVLNQMYSAQCSFIKTWGPPLSCVWPR